MSRPRPTPTSLARIPPPEVAFGLLMTNTLPTSCRTLLSVASEQQREGGVEGENPLVLTED